jgi:hypothetical protein
MSKPTNTPGSLIADHLKQRLAQAASEIQALRTREVRKTDKRAGILVKAELCLLCGNADRPGACTCTLIKAEHRKLVGNGIDHKSISTSPTKDNKHVDLKFTAHKIPMTQTVPHNKVASTLVNRGVPEDLSHAFQGEHNAKMGKGEGLSTAGRAETQRLKTTPLATAGVAEAKRLKPNPIVAGVKSLLGKEELDKVTPPDVSEKIVHKLKDEYGHDKEGKEKAFATAWKIHNEKTDKAEAQFHEAAAKDCKLCGAKGQKVRQDGQLVTHAQPGKEKGLCNGIKMIKEEMGADGMQMSEDLDKGILSTVKRGVATAALAGGLMSGGAAHAQSSKPNTHASAKKPKAAEEKPTYMDMSGPAEKESEFPSVTPKGSFKSEMCSTHGADLKKCGPGCGSMKPVAKAEGVNHCPACGGEGHHIGTMKQKDHFMCRHCGNGFSSDNPGTVVEKEEMVANVKTAPEKTLPGAELPSDAGEKTVEAEGSGGQVSEKSDPAIKKSEKLQKDTARSMAGMEPWKKAGSMPAPQLPGMTAAKPKATVASIRAAAAMHPDTAASLASVKAAAPAASWKAQGLPGLKAKLATVAAVPIHEAAPVIPGRSLPAEGTRKPVPLSQPSDAANLASDKKAAGIGFLSNLISRFKGIGNKNWAKVGNGNANRIGAGAAALARSEKPMGLRVKSTIPKLVKKMKPMTKAEAFGGDNGLGNCLHCRKIEHGGPCKPLAKEMMDAPTSGLSSVNHNVRLVTRK